MATPSASGTLVGKCDGVTADPATGQADRDRQRGRALERVRHRPGHGARRRTTATTCRCPAAGGTDAISIYDGLILISASAPGTTGMAAPQADLPGRLPGRVRPKDPRRHCPPALLRRGDGDTRPTVADPGKRVRLALTDPDSNEDVPAFATRFAGDFMLTSQGDKEQIFVQAPGSPHQALSVLKLSDSVDDTAWASDRFGAIYTTDNSNDTVNKITGPFTRGEVFVADTPCDANDAPSTCPGPGLPPNFLGQLNPETGSITRVHLNGPAVAAQGMYFRP